MKVSVWSHMPAVFLTLAAGSLLLLVSGCEKDKSAEAQSPPPQSLSEPVRPVESPSQTPVIPTPGEEPEYASTKAGETRPLPAFTPPEPVPPPPVAAPAPSGGCYHTLAKGETLYALSRMYNVKAKDIIAANSFKDPNKLSVGTKVYIPKSQ